MSRLTPVARTLMQLFFLFIFFQHLVQVILKTATLKVDWYVFTLTDPVRDTAYGKTKTKNWPIEK